VIRMRHRREDLDEIVSDGECEYLSMGLDLGHQVCTQQGCFHLQCDGLRQLLPFGIWLCCKKGLQCFVPSVGEFQAGNGIAEPFSDPCHEIDRAMPSDSCPGRKPPAAFKDASTVHSVEP
jgi:hypothetical protein